MIHTPPPLTTSLTRRHLLQGLLRGVAGLAEPTLARALGAIDLRKSVKMRRLANASRIETQGPDGLLSDADNNSKARPSWEVRCSGEGGKCRQTTPLQGRLGLGWTAENELLPTVDDNSRHGPHARGMSEMSYPNPPSCPRMHDHPCPLLGSPLHAANMARLPLPWWGIPPTHRASRS
jgi:hypothetical protein